MAEQYAGRDAFGMLNENYDHEEYDDYAPNTAVGQHSYSQTIQDLDFTEHGRRYSAVDFDTTQYMNGYDQYQNNGYHQEQEYDLSTTKKSADASYAAYAARQKIAELATIARKHEQLLKQQQQAIEAENERAETGIYQKVERPKNRKQWICGTHVLVQRDKSTQWFHGTIVNIYFNAMGEEVLTVLYYEFRGQVKYKTVRRYDKNVKAPNEDAWELFKKEENKDMTLYQKLFTGIKGNEQAFYDQLGDIGVGDDNAKDLDLFGQSLENGDIDVDDNQEDEEKKNDDLDSDETDSKKKKRKNKKNKNKKRKKKKKDKTKTENESEDGDESDQGK
eukprot:CAMPEP_0201573950 /NCGR_PEP_ID=MMETSP0190_2-20130828/18097_1 /ASSEMBLY_ACC=CAM_ASM_000263 /TAXON_ID=37353 /ORGANISM="Rosalina sp." /LENGTH=332 /DNA_ID=CAMNT_0048001523 /DNA_START=20 /DNA_END=1015 /DNA_ORIENTATION=-